MTNLELLQTLFESGLLEHLKKKGFISSKVYGYYSVYAWIQAQTKTRGITKNQAVLEAEIKFNKNERTIWRALKFFS